MLLSMILACRDPYEPKILSSPDAYLVIEGLLNVNGPTSISLSRTNSLDSTGFTKETGAQVLVEPIAVMYLLGTEMDFRTDKLSAQFVFNNPNQTSACGCGESVALTAAVQSSPAGAH